MPLVSHGACLGVNRTCTGLGREGRAVSSGRVLLFSRILSRDRALLDIPARLQERRSTLGDSRLTLLFRRLSQFSARALVPDEIDFS